MTTRTSRRLPAKAGGALASLVILLSLGCTRPAQTETAQPVRTNATSDSRGLEITAEHHFIGGFDRHELAAGTPVNVELNTAVDSRSAVAGQPVRGTVISDVRADGVVLIPAGTAVAGTVSGVQPAKHFGGQALVSVRFDNIAAPGGNVPIEGTMTATAKKSTGADTGKIVGGTLGGALLGKVIGGSGHDAAVGAVVGGGIGTAAAANRGQEAFLPSGSQVVVRTLTATTLRASNS